jgi:tripartite-type tricarboxylate transporter receptor subunit TctC
MKFTKIAAAWRLLFLTGVIGLIVSTYASAEPNKYPNKLIKIVSPFAPGGTNSYLSRLVAKSFEEKLGARVIVENKPGANGMLGADLVAKSVGDPYIFVMGGSATHGINGALYPNITYDILKDFTAIGVVATVPVVLIANLKFSPNNVSELIAYAKSNPGAVSFGSSGAGGSGHVVGEKFQQLTQTTMVHVPYRGDGPAITDVIGGQIPIAFMGLSSASPFIQSGSVKVLAVARTSRTVLLPDVPTFQESGVVGADLLSWYALFAPSGIPAEVAGALNEVMVKNLSEPETKAQLAAQGLEPGVMSAAETTDYVREELMKYRKIVKELKITVQ